MAERQAEDGGYTTETSSSFMNTDLQTSHSTTVHWDSLLPDSRVVYYSICRATWGERKWANGTWVQELSFGMGFPHWITSDRGQAKFTSFHLIHRILHSASSSSGRGRKEKHTVSYLKFSDFLWVGTLLENMKIKLLKLCSNCGHGYLWRTFWACIGF